MTKTSVRDVVGFVIVASAAVILWFAVQERADRIRLEAQQEVYIQQIAEAEAAAAAAREDAREAREAAVEAVTAQAILADSISALSDSLDNVVRDEIRPQLERVEKETAMLFGQIRVITPEIYHPVIEALEIKFDEQRQAGLVAVEAFEQERASRIAVQANAASTIEALITALEAAEQLAAESVELAEKERLGRLAAETLATPGVLGRVKMSLPFFSIEGTVAGVLGFVAGVAVTR